jgi:hypothetical protein
MKRKTHKTDWAILRHVAEHSPPEYADQIRERNQRLLTALKKGEDCNVFIGCPHCREDCKACTWTVALPADDDCPCTDVHFGGVSLEEVRESGRYIRVLYGMNGATVCQYPSIDGDEIVHRREYEECRRFLKAHIEWANRKYWGKKL